MDSLVGGEHKACCCSFHSLRSRPELEQDREDEATISIRGVVIHGTNEMSRLRDRPNEQQVNIYHTPLAGVGSRNWDHQHRALQVQYQRAVDGTTCETLWHSVTGNQSDQETGRKLRQTKRIVKGVVNR